MQDLDFRSGLFVLLGLMGLLWLLQIWPYLTRPPEKFVQEKKEREKSIQPRQGQDRTIGGSRRVSVR
jgi:hypothetical protein